MGSVVNGWIVRLNVAGILVAITRLVMMNVK
jgi:hypothetical protein